MDDRPSPSESNEGRVLAALLAVVVVLDLSLLIAPPGGNVADLVRVTLAAFAVGVAAMLVLGTVRGSVHPAGLAGVPIAVIYAYSGLLLPWTRLSFWLGQASLDAMLAIPLVGEPLAAVLFGGVTLSATTLRTAFAVHLVALGAGTLALLYLVGDVVLDRLLRSRLA